MKDKPKHKKKRIAKRLNIFFLSVFLLFSVLILRLGVIQIVYGKDFKREIQRIENVDVNNPVPRGKIYDRNGKIIVDNTPLNTITYTKGKHSDQKEMLEIAEKLSNVIAIDTSKIRDRDKKDYWILKNPKKAKKLITKKEMELYDQKKLNDKQVYSLQLKRISKKDISHFSEKDLKILAIFRQMNSGYASTPQLVKNKDVTQQEFAIISENLEKLPGVDTTMDWERKYVFGETLKTVLGNVSSSEEGLPKEQIDKYLAQGYSRNDRVGTSYLEKKYEDVLQGQKAKLKNITDKSGNIVSTESVTEGKRGDDLVLTIDMDLQQQVESILSDELAKAKQHEGTALLDRAFVVLMDPHTGEILTMAGKQIAKNQETGRSEMRDFALGNITTSYNVGSAVKGATILTGYETGAIKPGDYQLDEPLYIKGTKVKKSWETFGRIDDLTALQVSSNVYMWKTVIAMAGGRYVPNQPLPLKLDTFNTIRHSFSQYGLGTLTGIDLPNETVGFKGPIRQETGLLLDLVIGQYDTYTNMQLAQYISTIANGGYRVQPHIVKEIREPSTENSRLGPIIEEIQPRILNKINAQDDWIKHVQEGLRRVAQVKPGTAAGYFAGVDYSPAAKTGTAQAFYDGPERKNFGKEPPEVMNLSLVTFAPFDKPEIVMAILVPWAYQGNQTLPVNGNIGRRVLDSYFNLKKQRQGANQNLPSTEAVVQISDPNLVPN